MQNIVTGGQVEIPDNNPNETMLGNDLVQQSIDNLTSQTGDSTALQQPMETQPSQPTQPGTDTVTQPESVPGEQNTAPIQAATPIHSLGIPPWLQNNPTVQPLLPDIPNYGSMLAEQALQLNPIRQGTQLSDYPYTTPQVSPPALDPGTGQRLYENFEGIQRAERRVQLRSRLEDLIDYRNYNQNRPPTNEAQRNLSVPYSNRSINRNAPRQGEGEPNGWGGNVFQNWWDNSVDQVQAVGGAFRDAWNLITGNSTPEQEQAVREIWDNFVMGEPTANPSELVTTDEVITGLSNVGEMFPTARAEIGQLIERWSPQQNEEGEYPVNLWRGEFGEFGRGIPGALNAGVNVVENLAYAGVYTLTDTARALAGEAGDSIPFLNRIPNDEERRGAAYRFGQVFSGVDLGIANVRDGSGNRYLSFVDPEASREEQINQWSTALGISVLFGGGVDNLARVGRLNAEDVARAVSTGQPLGTVRAARRAEELGRAAQSVPDFRPPSTPDEAMAAATPSVPSEATTMFPGAQPGTTILPPTNASIAVQNLDEYVGAVPNTTNLTNMTPGEVAFSLDVNPTVPPPIPFQNVRSNEELLNWGQYNGVIPPDVTNLTNADVQRLQQVHGDSFNRIGAPIELRDIPGYRELAPGTPENTLPYGITEIVSEQYPDISVSAPGGYRLPAGLTPDDVVQRFVDKYGEVTGIDWTLSEAIADEIIPYDANAYNAYVDAFKQAYPNMRYGVVHFTNELDDDVFQPANFEALLRFGDELPFNEVDGVMMGHGLGSIQDATGWFSVDGMRSWQEIVDEMPRGTRIMVFSCSVERAARIARYDDTLGALTSDQWVILESGGNGRVINMGSGNFIGTGLDDVDPETVRADMEMFPADETARANIQESVDEIIINGGEPIEVEPDMLREQLREQLIMQFRHDSSVLDEAILNDEGVDEWVDLVVGEDLDVARANQIRQTYQIRNTGEPDVQTLDDTIRHSGEPGSVPVADYWRRTDAPVSHSGNPGAASEFLDALDDVDANGSALRELEQQIDELRREVVRQSQPIIRGDMRNLVRGNIADEIATSTQYGEIIPGTQIQELLPDVEPISVPMEGNWFHGTRQTNISNVNYHWGTPHEYGVGLYLTNDMDYANVAARASRVPNNPVPGTTRLNPAGTGAVLRVQLDANTGILDASTEVDDSLLDVFYRSAKSIFGSKLATRLLSDLPETEVGNAWLEARRLYAEMFNSPVPEVKFREFSREVSERLSQRGYGAIVDNRRGVMMAIPDESGRIRMNVVPVQENVGGGSKVEATYARHFMEAEMHEQMKHPVTEAWELQSRVRYENALMENTLKEYKGLNNQATALVNDMANDERALVNDAIAQKEIEWRQALANAEEDAVNTPEFQRALDDVNDQCF